MKYINIFVVLISLSCLTSQIQGSLAKAMRISRAIRTQWTTAVETGNLQNIKRLIDNAGVNSKTNNGSTALIAAVHLQREDIIEFLLSVNGIDVNARTIDDDVALIEAVKLRNAQIVKLLLQAPLIDVNIQDGNGNTPLIWAAYWGNENIAKLLLQVSNINTNIQNNKGWYACILAAWLNRLNICKWIAQTKTFNINAQNKEKFTALMQAAANGHEDAVKYLLAVPGIHINAQNIHGDTALTCAEKNGHNTVKKIIKNKIQELILKAVEAIKQQNLENLIGIIEQIGPDNIVDSEGNSLIDIACAAQSTEIIFFLLQNALDPQELLARFPFEKLNPTTDLFKYFFNLAFEPKESQNSKTNIITCFKSPKGKTDEQHISQAKCTNCSKKTINICGGCRKIYYCSLKCQKADWQNHKLFCKPLLS